MMTRREWLGAAAVAGAGWLVRDGYGQRALDTVAGASGRVWDVREFGAKGDGVTLDTRAVQAAIDSCHQAGGGSVHFATGHTFLIGTIYLKDHVGLYVETNAVVLGSDRLADYGDDVGLNPFYPETIDPCLIYAKGAVDIRLGGEGTIVGYRGQRFVPAAGATGRAAQQRPMLIRLESCRQVSVTDLLLKRCGSWCLHLKKSKDIFLRNVRIENEKQDGFDLESCENVSISDCHLQCGDDAIAITTSAKDAPSRNITVTNCLLQSRWAGIRFGPASKGDFENIAVSNCVIYNCNGGGIKLGTFEGAEIRNCVFENIVMDQVIAPITMFVATWPDIGSTVAEPPMMPPGRIRGVQFRGMQIVTKPGAPLPRPDATGGMFFHGHPQGAIEDVLLRDVVMTCSGGGTAEQAMRRNIVDMDQIDWRKDGYWTDHKTTWGVPPAYGLYARHVKGLRLEDVRVRLRESDARAAVFCYDSEDVRVNGLMVGGGGTVVTARNCKRVRLADVEAQPKAEVLLRLEGAASEAVVLAGNDAREFGKMVEVVDGARDSAVMETERLR